jgi:hypothetical protein
MLHLFKEKNGPSVRHIWFIMYTRDLAMNSVRPKIFICHNGERENSLGFFSSNFEKNLLFSFLFLKTCLADEHSTYNISGAPLERPSSRKSLMSIKWSAQPKKCRKETKKNREPPTVCWLGASLSLLQIYFLAKISWKGKSHNPMASPNRDTLGIAQTSSARQSLICRRVGCGPTEITHTHTHTMGAVK